MRHAVLLLVLVACGHGDPKPAPPLSGEAPPSTAVAPAIPAGWIVLDPPDEDRLHCANYSDDEWQVAIDGSALRFAKAIPHEPDTGPAITDPPRQPRGRRHVVQVRDGFLAGYDGGEWGGALYWMSKDGATSTALGQDNVHGVVAIGDDEAIALEGLAHMGINEGAVRWLARTPAGWSTRTIDKLDGQPQALAVAPDAVYTITLDSLYRIKRDHTIDKVQTVSTPGLYPDSMAVDATGGLWIGMRQLVLHLIPDGGTYKLEWLAEATCRHATKVDLHCDCSP